MYEDEDETLTLELTRAQAEALWAFGEVGADVFRTSPRAVTFTADYDMATEALDELKGTIGEDRCAELVTEAAG